jgi:putative transposase
VVAFVLRNAARTQLPVAWFLRRLGIGRDKFCAWRRRAGQANAHNGWVPREFWLEPWEKEAIVAFYRQHPREGYRRLTYMMLDRDVVAVSCSSTYRVLKAAGLLRAWDRTESKKGTGFVQPLHPHEHWHIDVSYLNIHGTFYYFCALLDGASRYIAHWEIRQSMTEKDIEIIIERAREKFPTARPRVISDNGPQFIARDFKEYIRLCGMTHVRTAPHYPQSNGKAERFHQSLKRECIRPKTPVSLEDARRTVGPYVEYYNNERLHSAIGYVAPRDKLEGRSELIFEQRKEKLAAARARRERRFALSQSTSVASVGGT